MMNITEAERIAVYRYRENQEKRIKGAKSHRLSGRRYYEGIIADFNEAIRNEFTHSAALILACNAESLRDIGLYEDCLLNLQRLMKITCVSN